ncbi:hypothetical protein D3C80_2090610 [compost metagenome]
MRTRRALQRPSLSQARSYVIAADSTAPASPSSFNPARSSARVRPRLTMAIGIPASCALRTKRKPE